jgi:hypothetical protein
VDWVAAVERHCQQVGLLSPVALKRLWRDAQGTPVEERLFTPGRAGGAGLKSALSTLAAAAEPAPHNLLPLMDVDEASIACVVCGTPEVPEVPGRDMVVRWHLDEIPPEHQGATLDTDADKFVTSMARELSARPKGLDLIYDDIGEKYKEKYIDQNRRPRGHVVRPVQLACQNVIVGLAAFAQDMSFDGLRVDAWQTCEVPHVATHEGNRAMAALMLCDAFRNGGTMEIRFHRHPERAVPASLSRYARTWDIDLGTRDPKSISPAEARELFLAVTPMPGDLRRRVLDAATAGVCSPERLCFTLLAQVWREPELDFMLACSERTATILEGGSEPEHRGVRHAEAEVCRSAEMTGMLFRRLSWMDHAAADDQAIRTVEDVRHPVRWEMIPAVGAVRFVDAKAGAVPWRSADRDPLAEDQALTVLPRSGVTEEDLDSIEALSELSDMVAVLVPQDGDASLAEGHSIEVLRCPDGLSALDRAVERRLQSSRLGRA